MRENRSTWEMLGALLGLVLLIAVLYAAVGYFRTGTSEMDEAARVAGRPITLAETLSGEGGEAITATAELTSSVVVTGAAAVTMTAEVTTTAATTATTETPATDAITTTEAMTESVVTVSQSPTTTTQLTATQLSTATTVITAATAVTEDGAVLTTTAVVTTTNELTATDGLTGTEAITTANPAPEAPAEVAAIFLKAGCIGCHVIPGVPNAIGQIGPNLSNIGVDGATRIEGYSSEEYIRESLLNPNAYIAPECPTGPCLPNLMVQNLGDTLTPEEIDAVVAYLATMGVTAP
jgi:mono/diheme cytochrome c family protein